MPNPPKSCSCGNSLQDDWKICPYCGRPSGESEIVVGRVVNASIQPSAAPPLKPSEASVRQFKTDQSLIGFGLIGLGVLGFVGGCGLLLSGSLTRFGSMDAVVGIFLTGGGLTVTAIIVGTAIISHGAGAKAGASTGLLGGLLAGFMALGVCGLTVIAMLIYAVETCLNGCQ